MISLKGYKTKITIVVAVIYAITGLLTGHLEANEAWAIILTASGAWGIYDKIDRR